MSVAQSETRVLRTDLEHTNTTVTSQEADLASLTTWVDDLDNRGRRLNLRVRGVREGDPAEHIPDILKRLFTQVLGGKQIPRLGIVRAHRVLGPMPPPEEQPRDIICCLENDQLKEDILRTAYLDTPYKPEGRYAQ
ncbi:Hypothetical predicted protein [Pelobates cultripes]|uniref:Uncharacterized protein n=1 Tax=Pelobates cultripes TaxID=61616 RepID=A0AAD1RH77_PELCU|nr:Hypothetical predicted protein [Pelobates cultripes]